MIQVLHHPIAKTKTPQSLFRAAEYRRLVPKLGRTKASIAATAIAREKFQQIPPTPRERQLLTD